MSPLRSYLALCLASSAPAAAFRRRASAIDSAPFANTTVALSSSLSASSSLSSSSQSVVVAAAPSSAPSLPALPAALASSSDHGSGSARPSDAGPLTAPSNASVATASPTGSPASAPAFPLIVTNGTDAPPVSSANGSASVFVEDAAPSTVPAPSAPPFANDTAPSPPALNGTGPAGINGTTLPPFSNATASPTVKSVNASCTVFIPSASIDYWYPATYAHAAATFTTAWNNFSNSESYTTIPNTIPFDVAGALATEAAYTTELIYVEAFDYSYIGYIDYTDKPTAAATSVVWRNNALPLPAGGVIPTSDAFSYDVYNIEALPAATATITVPPSAAFIQVSATPYAYFTAYEVAAGNRTETVQLSSAAAYPYSLKGIDQNVAATGPLPDNFLDSIPQSACESGTLQATVTVLIVVDLYYRYVIHADPLRIHVESTVLGFDETVNVNNQGSQGVPITMADWDLPTTPKPTTAITTQDNQPNAAPTTRANNVNTNNMNNAGSNIPQGPNAPQQSSVTVGNVGTQPVVIGPSSVVVVGDQTLQPGGRMITVGGGTPVSLAPSGDAIVIGGSTSQLPQVFVPTPEPQVQPPPVITIGSNTIVPNAATQFFVAPGQTLTPGGTVVVDGTVVSLAPSASFVVIGGSTQALPAGQAPSAAPTIPPEIVVGGSTITAVAPGPSNNVANNVATNQGAGPTFVVGGQTLAPGGQAITVSGTTLSLAPSGSFLVVNGQTSTIAAPVAATSRPTIEIGGTVFAAPSGSGNTFVIGGQTLAPGGSAITVSGTTISLAPSASFVVVNGVTSSIATPAAAQITPPPLTVGTSTFLALSGSGTTYQIGTQLLTPGGVITVGDTTISLAPSATALVVNGQTTLLTATSLPVITAPPVLTIGSSTYTAASGTGTTFIISGQTLTPGGTVVVDGTTISLAPGATQLVYGSSGRSTTTALFPATTTRGQSVTSTGGASAGASGRPTQAAATSVRQGAGSTSRVNTYLLALLSTLGLLF